MNRPDPAGWGGVALASCLYGTVRPEFVNSWGALVAAGGRPGDALMQCPIDMPVHQARNTVVDAFLTNPTYSTCGALLFVDHDHAFPHDTLERLRSDPRGVDYGVLGAVYRARVRDVPIVYRLEPNADPANPTFAVARDWTPGDVVDVDLIGMGFTLIRRAVLAALCDPWFYYLGPTSSEDVAFCRDVREAGHRIGVHTGVDVDHMVTRALKALG